MQFIQYAYRNSSMKNDHALKSTERRKKKDSNQENRTINDDCQKRFYAFYLYFSHTNPF